MTREEPVREIKVGDDWTVPDLNGVGRRTLVQGAVWTVPVIAAATATPAFAASLSPTLEFTQGGYPGTACELITGVQVRRTTDGSTPDPGTTVTVTLSDGYTFTDGSTVFTDVTAQDGTVTLPDIVVPSGGGQSTFAASSGTLTTSAPVAGASTGQAYQYNSQAQTTSVVTGIPAGSTAMGFGTFLAGDGGLYYAGAGQIASGATSAAVEINSANNALVWFVANGVAYRYDSKAKTTTTETTVPAGTEAVGWGTFLAPDGSLYYAGAGEIATGVTSVAVEINGSDTAYVWYVSNGIAYQYDSKAKTTTPAANVPSGTTALGWGTFLAPDGTLYYAGAGAIATGATSAAVEINGSDTAVVFYVAGGVAMQYNTKTKVTSVVSGVPADTTTVGWGTYLADDGELYYANAGSIASRVSSAATEIFNQTNAIVWYVADDSCA